MHPVCTWLLKNAPIIIAAGNLVIEVGKAIVAEVESEEEEE